MSFFSRTRRRTAHHYIKKKGSKIDQIQGAIRHPKGKERKNRTENKRKTKMKEDTGNSEKLKI
jgi:hypothetical protein